MNLHCYFKDTIGQFLTCVGIRFFYDEIYLSKLLPYKINIQLGEGLIWLSNPDNLSLIHI